MRSVRVAPLLVGVLLAGGCVYLNSLYNARRSFDLAEQARIEGRSAEAVAAYDDAIRKASATFRKDPDGGWADDALYLLGRAYLGRGADAQAVAAFEEALARTTDPDLRSRARFRLGVALTRVGDHAHALPLLDSAAVDPRLEGRVGEVRLERARLLRARGRIPEAAFDLMEAEQLDPGLRVDVAFERLETAIQLRDLEGGRQAVERLVREPRAAIFADSIGTLVRRASRTWGAGAAAALLAPVREGEWSQGARDPLLLQRIALLTAAGDTVAAESEAGWTARGSTPGATEARLLLARLRLARIEEVGALDRVREILLPAAGHPAAVEVVADIRRVELLAEWGRTDDPLAWFAAAEMARDRLGADRLARGLFLRFASEAPRNPWAGKAILAALATTPDPHSDTALRGGLEARAEDPYVARARGAPFPPRTLSALEAELERVVHDLLARTEVEVLRRDLFLRGIDSIPLPPDPM